jgi:two-component system, NarL family, sensor kinase
MPPVASPTHPDPDGKDRLLWALGERVKELTALHGTARLLQDETRAPGAILGDVAALLPPAWQYPEITGARIAVGDLEAATPNFRRTPWMQTAPFSTRDGRPGVVEVAYLEEKPGAFEGPFLAEERALIRSLAQMLQSDFERRAAEADLKKAHSDLERQVRERTAELSRTNEILRGEIAERLRAEGQIRRLASQLALAEEREKRAIASDLHDHIGQALAVVKGRLGRIQGNAVFSGMEKELEEIQTLLGQTLQYTRTLTFDISPPVLYDLGLEPALEWLSKQFLKKHGLKSEVAVSGAARNVPDDLKITLFRSAQELLMNAVKHARAGRVRILLAWAPDRLAITVSDDGVGFDPARAEAAVSDDGGFGLFSIRERLKGLGGEMTCGAAPGRGAVITLSAPLPREGKKGETA